jgi:MoaA/NifB/PqqE/SkfB family radical SAM enzyme
MNNPVAIGMPVMPASEECPVSDGISFTSAHHFALSRDTDILALAEAASVPLSVIVQVTKRCDFGCTFCSETLQRPDPTPRDLETIRDNLAGVPRVFLSGGEPLLRRDLIDIVEMFSGSIIGLPTNATRGMVMAPQLAGKIAFANIGFDGPRATFRRVRGDYDKVMTGVRAFINAGIPISLSAVVQRSGLHGLPYLCQIADVLDAGKLKLIMPLRKGNALGMDEREFLTIDEARETFDRLQDLRTLHDWRPALRLTPWTAATKGHMIVIEPDGSAHAWPVYDQPDLFLELGNVLHEPITEIWNRYPYKTAHYAKYLGRSIHAAMRTQS